MICTFPPRPRSLAANGIRTDAPIPVREQFTMASSAPRMKLEPKRASNAKGRSRVQQAHMQERDEQIRALAHHLWEERGCPDGTPEDDWLEAERLIQERPYGSA